MAYTLSLVAKLGATVIFNRISRVDVNISLEELFRSNIEDRGNDVKLVKVKVGEERGGPWSDIDGSETILFRHNTYDRQHIYIWQTTNTIAKVCLTLVLWSEFTSEVIKKKKKIRPTDPSFCQRLWTNKHTFFFLASSRCQYALEMPYGHQRSEEPLARV